MTWPPQRIICLSEETAETLYLLGEDARIVGVCGYASRPARIRDEKPRVGAFTAEDMSSIMVQRPDLVLTSFDIQADISALLIRAGVAVHSFNQHDVQGIFDMTACVGAMVGRPDRAAALIDGWREKIEAMRANPPARRPRVWFEEWDEPLIAGLGWVMELIEIAGGIDIVSHLRHVRSTRERIVTAAEIAAARPELILASWSSRTAVRHNLVKEIKAPLLLAPGPAALTDGLDLIRTAVLEAEATAQQDGAARVSA
jgi:iron complex transport system substrate-binding protein